MKKRVLALALAMTMAFPALAMAESNIKVIVNDEEIKMDQPPLIENGRTMVPLRAVAEALGCEVKWDDTTKSASFVQGEVTAVITVGQNYILAGDGVYNQELPIDAPAVIVNSRTMIPLRALSECFGYNVEWDNKTKTVSINMKSMKTDDTKDAKEQESTETNYNLAGKVNAYAQVLKGVTSILDSVGYTTTNYENVKTELNTIADNSDSMTYDELIKAFSKLKEIDESLADMSNDAGVSDIVADYTASVQSELNEIMSK